MAIATEIEARKARWRAFYQQTGAPAMVVIHCDPDAPTEPLWPWPSKRRERLERAWDAYGRQMDCLTWLDDDSLPHLHIMTGTEIFAEAFGCAVHRPDDNMPAARPRITHASQVAKLRVPELSSSSLAYLFDMADELQRRAGVGALFRMIDVQSPLDIAALIWDKNEFYPAIVEAPEAVLELADQVRQLLTAFLDEWFARYGQDFIAHFPYYYMPYGVTLSEDEVGVVSPRIFADIFLPELVALSQRYGMLGMHCCADSRHQWEQFLRIPNLCLLNLVQPEEVVREAYRFFAPHVAQMHSGYAAQGPAWSWPAQLPPDARIVYELGAPTRDEAVELAANMREAVETSI